MNQDILLALAKLHHQGHEVTLARLKGAATGRHPMPALIQAIKAYQADPQAVLAQLPLPETPPSPAPQQEDRLAQLERQVALLSARLEALEAKLR
ncbi:hypothetical protein FCL40_06095 [Ferrimonas sediminicola]|uniref:Uncharacterized protein n=1 Tax=Ferrimonas sediminicola TaxID=2569538 RepID=A0A4U1BEV2_9GAMM|nr:hypothetical protein [Ferrimonas sediminicola]TKB49728.1 hypothetical protein FCL40_06095 [Ferrimonas sediminicola]